MKSFGVFVAVIVAVVAVSTVSGFTLKPGDNAFLKFIDDLKLPGTFSEDQCYALYGSGSPKWKFKKSSARDATGHRIAARPWPTEYRNVMDYITLFFLPRNTYKIEDWKGRREESHQEINLSDMTLVSNLITDNDVRPYNFVKQDEKWLMHSDKAKALIANMMAEKHTSFFAWRKIKKPSALECPRKHRLTVTLKESLAPAGRYNEMLKAFKLLKQDWFHVNMTFGKIETPRGPRTDPMLFQFCYDKVDEVIKRAERVKLTLRGLQLELTNLPPMQAHYDSISVADYPTYSFGRRLCQSVVETIKATKCHEQHPPKCGTKFGAAWKLRFKTNYVPHFQPQFFVDGATKRHQVYQLWSPKRPEPEIVVGDLVPAEQPQQQVGVPLRANA